MQNTGELEDLLKRMKNLRQGPSNKAYYDSVTLLAQLVRQKYDIDSPMSLKLIRKIYRQESIRIDTAPRRLKKVRGAYFCDEGDCSVLLCPELPMEPKLFTLAHELKHHYADQDLEIIYCFDVSQKSDRSEIGAEIFAAELIVPITIFSQCLKELSISHGKCSAEDVCRLKREFKIPMSYQSLCKRLYILNIVPWNHFSGIKFTKVSEGIYGVPYYKRNKFKQARSIS